MKKTYLDALMSIFTPIPLNNGFYFVDNNGTIDWILSNIFLLGYVLPVEGVMIGIFFLKSATTRLYDTEAKIICIVSKKGAQCIECHHKDI